MNLGKPMVIQVKFPRRASFQVENDHPGYSFEKTHWVFITGVEPLRSTGLRKACARTPLLLFQSVIENITEKSAGVVCQSSAGVSAL